MFFTHCNGLLLTIRIDLTFVKSPTRHCIQVNHICFEICLSIKSNYSASRSVLTWLFCCGTNALEYTFGFCSRCWTLRVFLSQINDLIFIMFIFLDLLSCLTGLIPGTDRTAIQIMPIEPIIIIAQYMLSFYSI